MITPESDVMAMETLKRDYNSQVPHEYVVTDPYKGCGRCGYGPGAAFHNTYEVERYEKAQQEKGPTWRIRNENNNTL